jgi:hypothetical protein
MMPHHRRNAAFLALTVILAASPLLAAPPREGSARTSSQKSAGTASAAGASAPAVRDVESGNPLTDFVRRVLLDAGIMIDGNG